MEVGENDQVNNSLTTTSWELFDIGSRKNRGLVETGSVSVGFVANLFLSLLDFVWQFSVLFFFL